MEGEAGRKYKEEHGNLSRLLLSILSGLIRQYRFPKIVDSK